MVWEQENKKMSEVLHLENKPGQACRLANPCHRKTLGLEPVKGCRFRSELSTLYFICRRAWDLSDKLPSETKYKKKNYIYVCHMSYIYVCHQPHHAHQWNLRITLNDFYTIFSAKSIDKYKSVKDIFSMSKIERK